MEITSVNNVRGQVILVLLFQMCLMMSLIVYAEMGCFNASNTDIDILGVGMVNLKAGLCGKHSSVWDDSFSVLMLSIILRLRRQYQIE
jgi:hypothetical protein